MDAESTEPDRALLLASAVTELGIALEELHVAAEELGRQALVAEEMVVRYRELFELSPDGYVRSDGGGVVLEVNRAMAAMLGTSAMSMVDRPLVVFVDLADRHRFRSFLAGLARLEGQATLEVTMRPHRRAPFPAWMNVVAQRTGDDGPRQLLWAVRDVSANKALRDRLAFEATHDPLTGLANRAHFFDRLELALERSHPPRRVAVLFADLDGFKAVNDELGHEAGDELLRIVAIRMKEALRDSDLIARLGGDEFAVACDVSGRIEAIGLAERVRRAVAAPYSLHLRDRAVEASVTMSVGLALEGDRQVTSVELLREADAAMYQTKRGRARRAALAGDGMELPPAPSVDEVQAALDSGRLTTVYQPEIDLRDGRTVALEALARIDDPERGLVAAGEFMPAAEEAGLAHEIDRRVLQQSCAQLAAWHAQGIAEDVPLAINVSGAGAGGDLPAVIEESLAENALAPEMLRVELDEHQAVTGVATGRPWWAELQDRGVKVAVQGQGLTSASLAYLHRLPVDVIKINRSFVAGLGRDPEAEVMVSALAGMAGDLRLGVVASGVERPEQLAALRAAGCRWAQGHLFARPVPAADVADLLHRQWQAPLSA